MKENNTQNSDRVSGDAEWAILGGLRFLLASIVAISHIGYFAGANRTFVQGLDAQIAVIAFFAVSGYSMAHSLDANSSVLGFFRRRAIRLLPAYYVSVVAALVLFASGHWTMPDQIGYPMPSSLSILAHFFLLQGIFRFGFAPIGPVWTLGFEFVYYLISPLLRRVVVSRVGKLALLLLLIASAVAYDCLQRQKPVLAYPGWLGLIGLLWPFLIGFLWYYWRNEALRVGMLVGGLLVVECSVNKGPYATYTLLFSIAIIFGAASFKLPAVARKVLLYLGDLSYPLYLVHWPVTIAAYNLLHAERQIEWLLASIVATLAVHHGVEVPVHAWLRRPKSSAVSVPGTDPSHQRAPELGPA